MKVDTPLYRYIMDQSKLLINQIIMRRKKYEAKSQLVRESRKYPDVHGYAVGDLVLNKSFTKLCIKGTIQKIEKRLGRFI